MKGKINSKTIIMGDFNTLIVGDFNSVGFKPTPMNRYLHLWIDQQNRKLSRKHKF